MQAIVTTYRGATNSRGARITATAERGRISLPYPHDMDADAAHSYACRALVARFLQEDSERYNTPPASNPWARPMAHGVLANRGHVFVIIPAEGSK